MRRTLLDKIKGFFSFISIFGWLRKDATARLQKKYEAKLKEAKVAEKFGNRALQANLYAEAEEIYKRIESDERGKND